MGNPIFGHVDSYAVIQIKHTYRSYNQYIHPLWRYSSSRHLKMELIKTCDYWTHEKGLWAYCFPIFVITPELWGHLPRNLQSLGSKPHSSRGGLNLHLFHVPAQHLNHRSTISHSTLEHSLWGELLPQWEEGPWLEPKASSHPTKPYILWLALFFMALQVFYRPPSHGFLGR